MLGDGEARCVPRQGVHAGAVVLMACLFAMAGSASAATYNLRAGTVNITMPDGAVIPAWGFADDTGITAGTGNLLL